ncbi:hypothetical protein PENARI_c097G02685 [Penicillium arizonense]|uniref:Uncharacterized protein n=1 Tax=Penicillium arizonense TaxID=1835702 RepID=A0A1F5L1Q7_PENAI|nr:hypothetical protein PENARI_c097G02685 [Penicillium arizonense]OGE46861.1 hypothetical protein PENARI_c097G02685 [Penicillium arizonense]
MSPRRAYGWPEWEEKNLLPWLDAHPELSWKALSDAYYEEYQVHRSVESLRGKKYHILRKQSRTGAKASQNPDKPKRAVAVRRSVVDCASQSNLSAKTPAQRNIDKWFQTILAADPNQPDDSKKPTQTNSISDRLTPAPLPSRPKRTRSSSWRWDYVHRVCAARKLRYRRTERPL